MPMMRPPSIASKVTSHTIKSMVNRVGDAASYRAVFARTDPGVQAALATRYAHRWRNANLDVSVTEGHQTVTLEFDGQRVLQHTRERNKSIAITIISHGVGFALGFGAGYYAVGSAVNSLKSLFTLSPWQALKFAGKAALAYTVGPKASAYVVKAITNRDVNVTATIGFYVGGGWRGALALDAIGDGVATGVKAVTNTVFNPSAGLGGEAGRPGSALNRITNAGLSGSGESWNLFEL